MLPDGVRLVLLAPALGPGVREALLGGIRRTPGCVAGGGARVGPRQSPAGDVLAACIPWPRRAAQLSREIEDVPWRGARVWVRRRLAAREDPPWARPALGNARLSR